MLEVLTVYHAFQEGSFSSIYHLPLSKVSITQSLHNTKQSNSYYNSVSYSFVTYYFHLSPGYGDLVEVLQHLSLIHGILGHLNIWKVWQEDQKKQTCLHSDCYTMVTL